MQKFYRDKSKIFECNISVDGAKLDDTKARLVLEFPENRNLLFYGKIKSDGKCEIAIPALKELDECEGVAKLEIIAESTYFESWKEKFALETNKKVTVEMVEKEEEPILDTPIVPHVQIITKSEEKPIVEEKVDKLKDFKEYVKSNKINMTETLKTKDKYLKLLVDYKKEKTLGKDDIMELHDEIVSQHKKHLI